MFMKKLLITLMVMLMMIGFKVKAKDIVYSGKLDSINGSRLTNYLVYYDYKTKGSSPGTNQYGYEVAFNKDGIALEMNTNVKIPVDGFVLSAHGTKIDGLKQIKVGDRAEVDLESKNVVVVRDDLSMKMMAQLKLEDAKNAKDVAYNNGIIFDEEIVDSLISEIESKIELIENANSSELEAIVEEVSKLADEVIYRTSKTKSVEVRAVWHRPNGTSISEHTLNGIQRLINKFKEVGFNTIFLETFWNGYGSHESDILETHPTIGKFFYSEEYGFDYVKAFIGEAKKLGIEVHAWLHLFNAGSPSFKSKVVKDEWLVENYQGTTLHPNVYGGSYYYDPSNEEVLEFVESIIEELASKYDFAGIQYDYVRYYDNNYNQTPYRDSGYGVHAETKFKEAYNLTGNVRELIKQESYRAMWNEWRQGNITNAVKRFTNKINSVNPDLIISAAVVSNLNSARNTYMQDWYTWVKAGYIDMLAPMIYTGSSEVVKNDSADILDKLDNLTYLVSGIAPIYYNHSIMTQHHQIQATNAALGHSIFASQNVLNLEDVEKSLIVGRYRNDAMNITNKPEDIIKHTLTDLLNTITELTDKRNLITVNTKKILEDEINLILNMDMNNPGDLSKVLNRLNVLANLTLYIENENVQATLKEDVDVLYNLLDVNISRYLINHGLWDPETDPERPDPTSFEYPDIEDDENNDGGSGDPNGEDPIGDPADDEDEKGNSLLYYIIAGISFVVVLVTTTIIIISRKKARL